MRFQQILLFLGVGALYIGYSGVMGVLVRRATHPDRRALDVLVVTGHAILLFLPASIVVFGLTDLSLLARFLLVSIGICVAVMGLIQPHWTPEKLWKRAFGYRYFAIAMALAAIWGLGLAFSSSSVPPAILGAAAGIACAVSLNLSPPDATSPLR
jgi:hypothetical protein